jgi:hypothetical protein
VREDQRNHESKKQISGHYHSLRVSNEKLPATKPYVSEPETKCNHMRVKQWHSNRSEPKKWNMALPYKNTYKVFLMAVQNRRSPHPPPPPPHSSKSYVPPPYHSAGHRNSKSKHYNWTMQSKKDILKNLVTERKITLIWNLHKLGGRSWTSYGQGPPWHTWRNEINH